jgi:dihydroflavonol-4-reductase
MSNGKKSLKILVTGATGFIGAHTIVALLREGYSVRALVRSVEKFQKVLDLHGVSVDDVVTGDVTDQEAVRKALDGCDGVIHTAAMISTQKKDQDLVYDTNVNGTRYVIGGAVDAGLQHIIHVSSVTALYDATQTYLTGDLPFARSDSPYGKSKAAAEEFVRSLQERGAPITVTYPAAVIGPLDITCTEPHEGLLIFLKKAAIVTSTGIQYVDVRDVADAHVAIIKKKVKGARITVGGHYYTWFSLARELEEVTGRYLMKVFIPATAMKWAGRAGDILVKYGISKGVINGESIKYATRWVCTDDALFHDKLGLVYRPARQTMEDAVHSLWKMGFLESSEVGLLAARKRDS